MSETRSADSRRSPTELQANLAAVDEQILAKLSAAATADAEANEVTPPLTAGTNWTPQRIQWFEEYHRSRRSGLAGNHGEATWAIMYGGQPIGSVRLGVTESADTLETGIWLVRMHRGRGLARQAMSLVLEQARQSGALFVRADTASSNRSAQSLMESVGFVLAPSSADGRVHGLYRTVEPHNGT